MKATHVAAILILAACMVPGCGGGGGGGGGSTGSPGTPIPGDLQAGFGDGGSGAIEVNPDPGAYDVLKDVAVDPANGVLYAVGGVGNGAGTNYLWRIEKRLLSDGSLVAAFGTGGVVTVDPAPGALADEAAVAIAIDPANNVMYVLGSEYNGPSSMDWRVEKRTLDTGAPVLTFGTGGTGYETIIPSIDIDMPADIAIDGTSMILVGYDLSPSATDSQWRIEKRSLSAGALDGGFGTSGVQLSNPGSGVDEPAQVVLDGAGNRMYVIGTATGAGGDLEWRMEKRLLSTAAVDASFDGDGVLVVDPSAGDDELRGIALDVAGGVFYLAGDDDAAGGYNHRWRLEKRATSDGSLVGAFGAAGVLTIEMGTGYDFALGVYLDGPVIYVSGLHHLNPPLPSQDLQIMIHRLDAATGAADSSWGLGGVITENPTALVDGIAVFGTDATHLYMGGIENVDLINDPPTSNIGWRIEKRTK